MRTSGIDLHMHGYVIEEVSVRYNASLTWGVARDTVPLECCNSEYRLLLKQVSRLGIDGRMFRIYPGVSLSQLWMMCVGRLDKLRWVFGPSACITRCARSTMESLRAGWRLPEKIEPSQVCSVPSGKLRCWRYPHPVVMG